MSQSQPTSSASTKRFEKQQRVSRWSQTLQFQRKADDPSEQQQNSSALRPAGVAPQDIDALPTTFFEMNRDLEVFQRVGRGFAVLGGHSDSRNFDGQEGKDSNTRNTIPQSSNPTRKFVDTSKAWKDNTPAVAYSPFQHHTVKCDDFGSLHFQEYKWPVGGPGSSIYNGCSSNATEYSAQAVEPSSNTTLGSTSIYREINEPRRSLAVPPPHGSPKAPTLDERNHIRGMAANGNESRRVISGGMPRNSSSAATQYEGPGWLSEREPSRQRSLSVGCMASMAGGAFQPSRMHLERAGLLPPPQPRDSNYLGDPNSRSAAIQILNLPSEENCALWITYLPLDMTIPRFIGLVRTGEVFAAMLYEPEGGLNWAKAAKLVFKKHDAATEFLAKVKSFLGIVNSGLRMEATWNRVGYRENNTNKTRVLHLRGPPHLMTFEFWNDYFGKRVIFQLEGFRELPGPREGKKILEFRFARIDGQAEAMFTAVMNDQELARDIEIRYGADPCDPHSGFHDSSPCMKIPFSLKIDPCLKLKPPANQPSDKMMNRDHNKDLSPRNPQSAWKNTLIGVRSQWVPEEKTVGARAGPNRPKTPSGKDLVSIPCKKDLVNWQRMSSSGDRLNAGHKTIRVTCSDIAASKENDKVANENTNIATNMAIRETQARILMHTEPGSFCPFMPSYSAPRESARLHAEDPLRSIVTEDSDCTSKYEGDATTAHNISSSVSDDENCSLFITGLPVGIAYTQLLGAIRNVGKVFSTTINEPDGVHILSATKITFFERRHAEELFARIKRGTFEVEGVPAMDLENMYLFTEVIFATTGKFPENKEDENGESGYPQFNPSIAKFRLVKRDSAEVVARFAQPLFDVDISANSRYYAGQLRGALRILNFHPDSMGDIHPNCAVDLTFMNHRSAEAFKSQCDKERTWIHGLAIKVIWNRHKVSSPSHQHQSSVVRVKGPSKDFNLQSLLDFFYQKFRYSLVESHEWSPVEIRKIIELRFGSIRCQAEFAHMSLRHYLAAQPSGFSFKVTWANDPCNRGQGRDAQRKLERTQRGWR
ncbi:hypothetical protein G7Y89_g6690 [Cudoniella acicularis]|uniref:RRM domain-containing protein n=1 Tax=Cudoniella acicularis TaxID=354080 RepID=A0A8H4RJY4_9HELO|nr:hypothetical protein G7Y89_g6690 [Cudoniella acicularis]